MDSRLLEIFEELNKIPRCSGNELEISSYVLNFATNLGLWATRDEYNNIKVKKPAQGMTGDAIILQSHMDMVCVSVDGCKHDFNSDPIDILEADGWLTGNGTTLGADNGIGMAMMLSLMEDSKTEHPDLEFIFTTDEERGLEGAANIVLDDLDGRVLLNLDGEEEGVYYVSCAGGVRAVLSKNLGLENITDKTLISKSIRLFNCIGGHSGLDIQKQNANPIQLMARILKHIDNGKLLLHSFNGGDKENSIPTSANAIVSFPSELEAKIAKDLKLIIQDIKAEYPKEEKMELRVEVTRTPDATLSNTDKYGLLNLLFTIPNGAQKYNLETGDPSLSNNIGLLEFDEDKVVITNLLRSNEDSTKAELLEKIRIIASVFDFELSTRGDYSAWEYAYNSPLRDEIKTLYENTFKKPAEFQAIHAGLECAYFSKKRPDWDMISMGANIEYAHTPKERLEIDSAKRVYDFLIKLIQNL